MGNNILLRAEAISKFFPGTIALSDVSVDVQPGEIHAIVGENGAGKSTLMNIISGVYQPNKGKILFHGEEIKISNPQNAQKLGIGFVHQELSLCQHISVAENIFMGRMPVKRGGFIDYKNLYAETQKYLNYFDTSIKPSARTDTLNVAEQQIVEIAKAISMNCSLLILDEPTSSLSDKETENLFTLLKRLKSESIGILYISHRMPEIFNLCDRVTILRDGEFVETLRIEDTTERDVICKMVGRTLLEDLFPPKSKRTGETILEVSDFYRKGVFKNINFSLKKGEILGFAGLVGAGRTEIARALCGIDKRESGTLRYYGEELHFHFYSDALNRGICYLTENRKEEGLFLGLPIKENVSVSIIDKISKNLFISKKEEKNQTNNFVKKLRIKISSINNKADSLSGGNQQKVVIAKWLAIDPKVIIMDEPTRGIDVGAKSEIHKMIRDLSDSGIGIIIISSEMTEIIGMCDRVLVLHEGKITRELTGDGITEKNIIIGASGHDS